jgi:hypothetical protein
VEELLDALQRPDQCVSANLIGLALAERPAFFAALASRLTDLRMRTGRPHWFVVDEAHHVLGASREPSLAPPLPDGGVILVTVEPTHVAPSVIAAVDAIVALGRDPAETLHAFAAAVGEPAPPAVASIHHEADHSSAGLFWRRGDGEARRFDVWPSESERRRHRRKYAEGDFGPCSFFFRGPDAALNLRAQNLQVFTTLAAGVDDATWNYHLRRGDVARWIHDCVKDPELAALVADVAATSDIGAAESRRQVIEAVNARYTAPA